MKAEETTPPIIPRRNLPKIDRQEPQGPGLMRHITKNNSEIFTASLYELGIAIADKRETELQDESGMQALIDRILPEWY